MSIVILGADGLLGRQCQRTVTGSIALAKGAADLTRPLELRLALTAIGPEVVINCAGFTAVDRADSESAAAYAVNALGVRDLALICQDLDSVLIHVSSDQVFGQDRQRATPYAEDDVPGPINQYGASKLAGEKNVIAHCEKHFILRTCGLHGAGPGRNFVQAILHKARAGESLRVVHDQICTPTGALDFAAAIAAACHSKAYGLYHVTNAGSCSWFEFAQAIVATAGLSTHIEPISSDEYAAAAARPAYSVLDGERWRRAGFTPLRSWRAALEATVAERLLAEEIG